MSVKVEVTSWVTEPGVTITGKDWEIKKHPSGDIEITVEDEGTHMWAWLTPDQWDQVVEAMAKALKEQA